MRTIWFIIQLVLVFLAFYVPWPFFFVMCAVEGVYGICKIIREEIEKALNPPPAPAPAVNVAPAAPAVNAPPRADFARWDGVGGFGWFPAAPAPARDVVSAAPAVNLAPPTRDVAAVSAPPARAPLFAIDGDVARAVVARLLILAMAHPLYYLLT